MFLSNSGHGHLRNSVAVHKKVAQFIRSRSKRLSRPLFFHAQTHEFWKVCAAFFQRRSGFLRTCLDNVWTETSSRILEESGEERHQSRIRSRVDLKTSTAWRSCVLVSSLNGISDLFKEHSHLHEPNDGSSVFSDAAHTRCKSATRDPIAGVLRVQGERHLDEARSPLQQSGRCRRRCTC